MKVTHKKAVQVVHLSLTDPTDTLAEQVDRTHFVGTLVGKLNKGGCVSPV